MLSQLLSGRQMTFNDLQPYITSEADRVWLAAQPKVRAIIQKGKKRICQRCSNEQLFSLIPMTDEYYCLNCISLGRISEGDDLYRFSAIEEISEAKDSSYLQWDGILSNEQQRASNELVKNLVEQDKIHIIQAVTGAGKTEMIFEAINKILIKGGRVAVVSPRIDVCLELAPRLQNAFSNMDLLLMYGQMEEPYRYTQLVIATVHQLWKFYRAFDLIIVDEVDAFPLAADDTLHFAIRQALKEQRKLVYLTATPDGHLQKLLKNKEADLTILPARYHRHPLPEPQFSWIDNWQEQIIHRKKGILFKKIGQFFQLDGIKLLFMPSIPLAESLYQWLLAEKLVNQIEVVHARDSQRKEKVQKVRDGEVKCLITTTILERGVTFTNCHVFILGAENKAYTSSALIQMSGRVGRKVNYPSGTLIYGHFGISRRMLEARQQIKGMNKLAKRQGLLV